ncbi:MAG: hypothetical protein KAR07_06910 [Spirochaetes bacterium]|nr:hypothetical protein [Spirochaetota bacterium]
MNIKKLHFSIIILSILLFTACGDDILINSSSSSSSVTSSSSSSSSSVSTSVNVHITEGETNYIPIFSERWPSYTSPEPVNRMLWNGGGSTATVNETLAESFEGIKSLAIIYNEQNGGWWGFAHTFVTSVGGFTPKRTDMTAYWNWNLHFRIKGNPVSANNVIVNINSGLYNDILSQNDSYKTAWSLSSLGFTGSGDWEEININFSSQTNIDWKNFTFTFLLEGKQITANDTIYIDDLYWWIEKVNHGTPNPNPLPNSTPNPVNTTPDSFYDITYVGAKFVPPAGKTLLILGQDKVNIPENVNASGVIAGGFASYMGVSSDIGITNDSTQDFPYIQNSKWLVDTYPNTVLQLAMWMVGSAHAFPVDYPQNTTNGLYDNNIDTLCNWAKDAQIPIFLRIGYEFDGLHNKLEPTEYINAYKYIADRIRLTNGVTNIAFVWHSYASTPYNGYSVSDWYPGDNYVDWFGLSVFFAHPTFDPNKTYMNNFVDLARTHFKPVMIAEACPNGGIFPLNYKTWNEWFVKVFSYIYEKNIKAYSYINANWDLIPQFATANWGDTRTHQFPLIQNSWLNEINKPRYMKQSASLFGELLDY